MRNIKFSGFLRHQSSNMVDVYVFLI